MASKTFVLLSIAVVALARCAYGVGGDASPAPFGCLGEFELCGESGSCVLDAAFCGECGEGQYRCPFGGCAENAEDYVNCKGLKGTHFDWTLSEDERVEYLVKKLDVTTKIAQLTNEAPEIKEAAIPAYNWLNDDEHGIKQTQNATSFPNGNALGCTWNKNLLYDIGVLIAVEARGVKNAFTARGNRGLGENGVGTTLYAPNLNLVINPRWGRAQEVYSEDPVLTGELTYQFVSGLQTGPKPAPHMATIACCKHFAAYNLESLPTLRYVFSANVTQRDMWETYMPAFKSCIDARAGSVMCSYNAIDGVPTCASDELLNGVLRKQWGWNDGFVVSDYDAWANIMNTHKFCPNMTCAAATGLNAGMDQEGGGTEAIDHLDDALQGGKVTESAIDTAFARLMRARIRLGMMDPPAQVSYNQVEVTPELLSMHSLSALEAARQGIVLLKNENNALPLNIAWNHGARVAFIGPQMTGTDLLQGNYAVQPDSGVTSVMEALWSTLGVDVQQCPADEPGVDYSNPDMYYARVRAANRTDCSVQCSVDQECKFFTYWNMTDKYGDDRWGWCYLMESDKYRRADANRQSGTCRSHPSDQRVLFARGCYDVPCANRSANDTKRAIKAAMASQLVVLGLGLNQAIESEGHDREVLELPPGQVALVRDLRAAIGPDKPIVAVLVHGGTIALGDLADEFAAIVSASYPGQLGGQAIVDVLTGAYNPGGRTAVTWYKSTADLPKPGTVELYPTAESPGQTYRFFNGSVQYPFGFGLSYTQFAYSDLVLNVTSAEACDYIGVQVTVKNVGKLKGDEVVQLYVQQPDATVPVPRVQLADFERITLAPGASRVVSLQIAPKHHTVVYESSSIYDATIGIEKGTLAIHVGGGQPGTVEGVLSTKATITSSSMLSKC